MNPINFNKYPKWLKDIHKIYMDAYLWRRWNWYDFLEELIKIVKKTK